jgi:hypothetical protein
MRYVDLNNILNDTVESFLLFREIEDWCCDNIPQDKWKFGSQQICVYGVDLPGRIIFIHEKDLSAFKLRFGQI